MPMPVEGVGEQLGLSMASRTPGCYRLGPKVGELLVTQHGTIGGRQY